MYNLSLFRIVYPAAGFSLFPVCCLTDALLLQYRFLFDLLFYLPGNRQKLLFLFLRLQSALYFCSIVMFHRNFFRCYIGQLHFGRMRYRIFPDSRVGSPCTFHIVNAQPIKFFQTVPRIFHIRRINHRSEFPGAVPGKQSTYFHFILP